MAKARKAPQDISAKQIRRVQDSTAEIEKGINAVMVSPTSLAADNLDKARAGYNRAIDSGKMERNLRAVDLASWKRLTIAKVPRIAAGIAEAEAKLVQFHKQRNGWQDEIDGLLANMPTRTLSDNIARMTKQVTEMSKKSFDKSIK